MIRMISGVEGIRDIALTTNGTLLARFAEALREAGLKRVNVSLDAIDDDIFARMNGGGPRSAPCWRASRRRRGPVSR